ncbi:hypothetical protein SPHV1_220041 [Novosphingobium sp. KN65.2]|nr:hypothetical protein SPHV1_220041 [Novosphingobium sp. KN65.2]
MIVADSYGEMVQIAEEIASEHVQGMAAEPDYSLKTCTPSFRLDGRRALVTAAGRGIGLAAAAALAQAGAEVTLVARTASEIEEAAADFVAAGHKAKAATLDVSDLAAGQCIFRMSRSVPRAPQQCLHQSSQADVGSERGRFRCRPRPQREKRLLRGPGLRETLDGYGHARLADPHGIADGPCRWTEPLAVLCQQVGDGRHEQGLCARPCGPRHPLEHHSAYLHRNAPDQTLLRRRSLQGQGPVQDQARADRPARRPHGRRAVPRIRCLRHDDRHQPRRRWRLDCRIVAIAE